MPSRSSAALVPMAAALALCGCNQNAPANTEAPTNAGAVTPAPGETGRASEPTEMTSEATTPMVDDAPDPVPDEYDRQVPN